MSQAELTKLAERFPMLVRCIEHYRDTAHPGTKQVPEETITVERAIDELSGQDSEDYVAWCRYSGKSIVTCDSDAPRAFKVYRRAALEAARRDSGPTNQVELAELRAGIVEFERRARDSGYQQGVRAENERCALLFDSKLIARPFRNEDTASRIRKSLPIMDDQEGGSDFPLREALKEISEYWNGKQNERAMFDACTRMTEIAQAALGLRAAAPAMGSASGEAGLRSARLDGITMGVLQAADFPMRLTETAIEYLERAREAGYTMQRVALDARSELSDEFPALLRVGQYAIIGGRAFEILEVASIKGFCCLRLIEHRNANEARSASCTEPEAGS